MSLSKILTGYTYRFPTDYPSESFSGEAQDNLLEGDQVIGVEGEINADWADIEDVEVIPLEGITVYNNFTLRPLTMTPDGKILAITTNFAPFLHVFTIEGNITTRLPNPYSGTLPLVNSRLSPTGKFLAVIYAYTTQAGHHATIYKNNNGIYEFHTDVSERAGGFHWAEAGFTADEKIFMGVRNGIASAGTHPYQIFEIDNDDNFNMLPTNILPSFESNPSISGMDISEDGSLIAIRIGPPGVSVYRMTRIDGELSFTKITVPSGLPSGPGGVRICPNSKYLVMTNHVTAGNMAVLKIEGNTSTRVTATQPSGLQYNSAFSPDSNIMCIATSITPCLWYYTIDQETDTITNRNDLLPVILPHPPHGLGFNKVELYMYTLSHITNLPTPGQTGRFSWWRPSTKIVSKDTIYKLSLQEAEYYIQESGLVGIGFATEDALEGENTIMDVFIE